MQWLFIYICYNSQSITTITKYYRDKYKVACHQLFFLRASPSDIFGYSLTPQKSSPILVLVVELEMTVEYGDFTHNFPVLTPLVPGIPLAATC